MKMAGRIKCVSNFNDAGPAMVRSKVSVPNVSEQRDRCTHDDHQYKNQAAIHARKIMRSESAQSNADLYQDYQFLVNGHCVYHNDFFCNRQDFGILSALSQDLDENAGQGMINWSQHFKHENPDFSITFKSIVQRLSDYFDLDVYATRLNFYPNNVSWKPFHHDSHAYGGRALREDFTVGASFGATRTLLRLIPTVRRSFEQRAVVIQRMVALHQHEIRVLDDLDLETSVAHILPFFTSSRSLVFKHDKSGHQFGFPQHNGDVFAFTSTVNKRFQHGVPKESQYKTGPRFSVIAWGRRRTITHRNGGTDEVGTRDVSETAHDRHASSGTTANDRMTQFQTLDDAPIETCGETSTPAVAVRDVTAMVQSFVLQETKQHQRHHHRKERGTRENQLDKCSGGSSTENSNRRRGRVQGGWGGGGGRGSKGGGRGNSGSRRGNNGDGSGKSGRALGCGGISAASNGLGTRPDQHRIHSRIGSVGTANTASATTARPMPPPEPAYSDDEY